MAMINEQEFYETYILPVFGVNVSGIEWVHNHRVVSDNPYRFYEEDVFTDSLSNDWSLFHTFEYEDPQVVAGIMEEGGYPNERFAHPSTPLDSSRDLTYYFDSEASGTDYPSAYYSLLKITTREERGGLNARIDADIAEWDKQEEEFHEKYKDLL